MSFVGIGSWCAAVLSRYYGQNFRSNALSNRQNLEQEPKADIDRALNERGGPQSLDRLAAKLRWNLLGEVDGH